MTSANSNKTLGFLKRNIKTRNQKIKTVAYQSTVRPQVEYAASVWDPHTAVNMNKIEMVQRRAARWVMSDYSTTSSVTNMLQVLGWRSLEQLRTDTRLIFLYNIVNHLVAVPSIGILLPVTRPTRHTHTLLSTSAYKFKCL